MKKTSVLRFLSLVIFLQLLGGCRFEVAKNPTSTQNGTKTETIQPGQLQPGNSPQNQKVEGTSDSGGGNGFDHRMLESYIIDPTELNEVKDIVLPILMKAYRQEV